MTFPAFVLLAVWCATLSVIDIREQRLPNLLTGCGAVVIFGYALLTTEFTAAAIGAVVLALPYLALHLLAPAALGAGDVKLAVGLGAATALDGAQTWVWAALGAPILTGALGLVCVAARRFGRDAWRATVPHGPSMCAATLLAMAVSDG